jgi:hypothetical protein
VDMYGIINHCASACFALSGNSIPAAPALRRPACGGRLGVKFS